MDEINEFSFNHRFHISILSKDPLIGLHLINHEILCKDKKFRPLIGIEIGLFFFTISYTHMNWKNVCE